MNSTQEKENIRKRAPNFTIREKTLLLNIISNYKGIIENKQTNATTWRDKDKAWGQIANTFNAGNGETYRTKENLKKYYENIKKNVRKEVAEERKEIYKTGGGVYVQKDSDSVKELTLNLINKKTVFGLSNPFDGDQAISIQDSNVYVVEEEPGLYEDVQEVVNCKSQNRNNVPVPNDHNYIGQEATPSSNIEGALTNQQSKKEQNEPTPGFSGHVSQPKTPSLQHSWTKRRRPSAQIDLPTKVHRQHLDTSISKQKCYEAELINIEARRRQDEELFQLQKEKSLLEIEIKKVELNSLLSKSCEI